AIAVLFMAETFASESGLGWFIIDAWTRVAYPSMYAGILALGLCGLGLFALLDAAERIACPWRFV
ncbi:MAG TPA: ABC transporter permease, partial [Spirochaetales bacterium]|nr:ABC transporter permease [Spirochaetales bacterium]